MITRRKFFAGVIGFIGAAALKPFAKEKINVDKSAEDALTHEKLRSAIDKILKDHDDYMENPLCF